MSEVKLKPCPFCGGKAVFNTKNNVADHISVGIIFEVECEECGMKLPSKYSVQCNLTEDGEINILNDGRKDAADKWNRRTD